MMDPGRAAFLMRRIGKLKERMVYYMTTEPYTVEGLLEDRRVMDVLALPEASLWEFDLIYGITTRQISKAPQQR